MLAAGAAGADSAVGEAEPVPVAINADDPLRASTCGGDGGGGGGTKIAGTSESVREVLERLRSSDDAEVGEMVAILLDGAPSSS